MIYFAYFILFLLFVFLYTRAPPNAEHFEKTKIY